MSTTSRVGEKCENAPHGPQGFVFVPDAVPVDAALALDLVCHERAQRELELRHVARELEFPGLAEWFGDRRVQKECFDDILRNGPHPGMLSANQGGRTIACTHHSRERSGTLNWERTSTFTYVNFSDKSFIYGLAPPPIADIGSALVPKSMR